MKKQLVAEMFEAIDSAMNDDFVPSTRLTSWMTQKNYFFPELRTEFHNVNEWLLGNHIACPFQGCTICKDIVCL